jgi:hypothetical protein
MRFVAAVDISVVKCFIVLGRGDISCVELTKVELDLGRWRRRVPFFNGLIFPQ